MTRQVYLSQIWKPYPAMPAQYQVAGRIYKIAKEGETLRLEILRDSRLHKVFLKTVPIVFDYLIEGDLVAVISETEILLLAPYLQSLPNRYFNKSILEKWNLYLNGIRRFFTEMDFLEVKTPTLVPCPGTEPTLDIFSTTLKIGSREQKLFLPTSPELHLKKALALGAEKIFEIANCYRNGEITEKHQPEFQMLEWYRSYDNLSSIKNDVVQLVQFSAKLLSVPPPSKILSYSVSELFKMYCNFDLRPETGIDELRDLAEKLSVDVKSAESIDDFFFLIFMEKIESQLNPDHLIFVEKYPPYQAALARLTEDGWGDRFEVYWKGLELANAFHELNDPQIQRMRSEEDLQKKKILEKEEIDLDQEFFQCLEAGMPPSGGIALGVERLFMALQDHTQISELSLFPKR
ncbi:MAG: EF-P lysine aminoacylase EpmA [Bdellovibrio sp.]